MESLKKKKIRLYLCGYLSGDRGQTSIIITFAIMFLLVSAAFFLTNSGFKNLEVATHVGGSSKSFYAAESGLEVFIFEKFKGTPPFELDSYTTGDIVACGCITNDGVIKTEVASGTPVECSIGGGATECNAHEMHFEVEKAELANNRVKSTGGYQNIERAVRMQW